MRTPIHRAATAGTTDASTTYGNASGSVCPKGWTLPSGETSNSGDFANLIRTVYGITNDETGSTKLHNAPLNFNLAGYYNYSFGSLYDETSRGSYWSISAGGSSSWANALILSLTSVSPVASTNRGTGFALRCVAR